MFWGKNSKTFFFFPNFFLQKYFVFLTFFPFVFFIFFVFSFFNYQCIKVNPPPPPHTHTHCHTHTHFREGGEIRPPILSILTVSAKKGFGKIWGALIDWQLSINFIWIFTVFFVSTREKKFNKKAVKSQMKSIKS